MDGNEQSRIKVLTLIDQLAALGGAERMAMEIATRLDPDRFESVLCASRFSQQEPSGLAPGPESMLQARGIRYFGLGRRSTLDVGRWVPLLRLLRRERFDVVHAHMFGSNIWGTLLGRLAGVPVVIAHEHTWSFEGQPMRRLLDRHLIGRGSSAFIAVSQEDRRRMIEIEGVRAEKVLFVPNGIATPPDTEPHDVRAELGIPSGAPVIGTVSVLRPQKALDVLLRAAAPLARHQPELRILIAGEGPERERLESLARELAIEDRVLMTGFRSDVPQVLETLDVAISSSSFEGSPLAVMEFMEAACPVVATRVGGVPDLIEHGVHGLLVPSGEVEGLTAAIQRMLDDPAAARYMGERARERRRRDFDIEVTVRRFEALYERLSGGGSLPNSVSELEG